MRPHSVSDRPWSQWISRGIGLLYGLSGLVSVVVGMVAVAMLMDAIRSQKIADIVIASIGSAILLVGTIVVFRMSLGFWRQEQRTYTFALGIHGIALIANSVQLISMRIALPFDLLMLDILTQIPFSVSGFVWNLTIVSFLGIPRFCAWRQYQKEQWALRDVPRYYE